MYRIEKKHQSEKIFCQPKQKKGGYASSQKPMKDYKKCISNTSCVSVYKLEYSNLTIIFFDNSLVEGYT